MKLFAVVIGILFYATPIANLVAQDKQTSEQSEDAKLQDRLTISRNTTRVEQSLDDQGWVDYVKAQNTFASANVTSEQNFDVIVRQVMGRGKISEAAFEMYCTELGIPQPQGPFLQPYDDFLRASDDQIEMFQSYKDYVKTRDARNAHNATPSEYAWHESKYPKAAKWLASVNEKLDHVVAESARPKLFAPLVYDPNQERSPGSPKILSAQANASFKEYRTIVEGLAIRSNRNIGHGDLDSAWSDIMAMYRISQLLGSGCQYIQYLTGVSCSRYTSDAVRNVIQSPELTEDQLRRFAKDLEKLPPFPSVERPVDMHLRWEALDALQEQAKIDKYAKWDEAALLINEWFDRLQSAATDKDAVKRRTQIAQLNRDIGKIQDQDNSASGAILFFLSKDVKKEKALRKARTLLNLVFPAPAPLHEAAMEPRCRIELLEIAFAARQYQMQNGTFPKQAPDMTDSLVDPFSGSKFFYRTDKNSLIVYSVGRNGIDDGGRSRLDSQTQRPIKDWDDIVVRVEIEIAEPTGQP